MVDPHTLANLMEEVECGRGVLPGRHKQRGYRRSPQRYTSVRSKFRVSKKKTTNLIDISGKCKRNSYSRGCGHEEGPLLDRYLGFILRKVGTVFPPLAGVSPNCPIQLA